MREMEREMKHDRDEGEMQPMREMTDNDNCDDIDDENHGNDNDCDSNRVI